MRGGAGGPGVVAAGLVITRDLAELDLELFGKIHGEQCCRQREHQVPRLRVKQVPGGCVGGCEGVQGGVRACGGSEGVQEVPGDGHGGDRALQPE